MAQHFKDLVVWQKAMDMVAEVYKLTDCFPKREVYSLTDQIRRAAVSVPSNIAEGQARTTAIENPVISCGIRLGPLPNLRHSYCSPSVLDMLTTLRRKGCFSGSTKLGES
jgi:23S rRNA-intervening sequence protein